MTTHLRSGLAMLKYGMSAEAVDELITPTEELPDLLVTRADVDAVLAREHTPEEVVALFSRDFGEGYGVSAGVHEGYTIGEHTTMALRQYHKYFYQKDSKGSQFMEAIIALHDVLGKPVALAEGDKARQHARTAERLPPVLNRLGYAENEIRLATCLLAADPIGALLKGEVDAKRAAADVMQLARSAGVVPDRFFRILSTLFQVDAGSYTRDAGGVESLDRLFSFDPKHGAMGYAHEPLQKIYQLERELESLQLRDSIARGGVEAQKRVEEYLPEALHAENFTERMAFEVLRMQEELCVPGISLPELERVIERISHILVEITPLRTALHTKVGRAECEVLFNPNILSHPLFAQNENERRRITVCSETVLHALHAAQMKAAEAAQAREKESLARASIDREQEECVNEAERCIDECDKKLSAIGGFLGFLPHTRFLNRISRDTARALRAAALCVRDGIGPSEVMNGIHDYGAREAFSDRGFMRFAIRISELEAAAQPASRARASCDTALLHAIAEAQQCVTDLIAALDVNSCKAALHTFGEIAALQMEEMRQFEKFLSVEVYPVLGISTEDETRARERQDPNVTSEAVRLARERSFVNVREMTRSVIAHYRTHGISEQETFARISTAFQDVRESAYISFTDSAGDFLAVLKDGVVRSVFDLPSQFRRVSHTGAGGGGHLSLREQFQGEFGYAENEHPVSMALGSSIDGDEGPAPGYGSLCTRFSVDALGEGAICTLGDAMNDSSFPRAFTRRPKWQRANRDLTVVNQRELKRLRQLTLEHGILAKALLDVAKEMGGVDESYFKPICYIEVMVPGRVPLSKANEIVLSRSAFSACEYEALVKTYGSLKKLETLIHQHVPGAKLRVSEETDELRASLKEWHVNIQRAYVKFYE